MKVILAGYNVDLESLKESKSKKTILTPETISAAYARISRTPKPVDVLRKEAREEVAKARRSNRTIIFEMGHHSIAEHAVFNFDIIGISRRAVEELEKFRLCSYTEKSQRYVTLKNDFVIPQELRNTGLVDDFLKTIKTQNNFYQHLFQKIREYNFKKFFYLAKDKKNKRILENLAKEDARYILSLAIQTQLGVTINARSLELIIRRFASHGVDEVKELGEKFFSSVKKIAPSIILFYKANDYDQMTYPSLQKYARRFGLQGIEDDDVELVDYTQRGDDKILASLLFKVSNRNYQGCLKLTKRMPENEKIRLFKKCCRYLELYDVVLREFEFANLTYSLIVSGACFGQLKRHRMATIISQEYDPNLGVTIPVSVKEVGAQKRFCEIIEHTEKIYQKIERKFPGIGSYILTNAHHKRVLLNINLRELYHLSRLREDPTAQWDIRNKAHKIAKLAKKVMPVTTQLLGGKSDYPKIYYELFGKNPKITEVPSP